MNRELARKLLEMEEEDLRVREDLLQAGELEDGYHPRMEAVHRQHAARLREIVAEYGWPGRALVGNNAASAAWLLLQHAIGHPDLQRAMLPVLQRAAAQGDIPVWQPAYLEDRIRFFEGRPQVYGTHWDMADNGGSELYCCEDPDRLDDRRAAVGLPPAKRSCTEPERGRTTEEVRAYRQRRDAWARAVGWQPAVTES